MLEFIKAHQLNMMLGLSSICGIIAIFVLMIKNLSRPRRIALFYMEVAAMLLLMFDRYAYMYRGNTSSFGFFMTRVSNFFVFSMTVCVIHAFNLYLVDLYRNEGGLSRVPFRLRLVEILVIISQTVLVISQFTDFYYSFDSHNLYFRTKYFELSYVIPLIILFIHFSLIVQYYRNFNRGVRISLLMFVVLPVFASILQIHYYGVSFTNLSCVAMAVILYIFSLMDLNEQANKANRLEIEYLRKEHDSMRNLFEQTATALVNAIDAKDKYTHGHSSRVAVYAKEIARISGKSDKEIDEVYYAALLHDVGKIGVSDYIIGKDCVLTNEEYEEVKEHTIIGEQILSSISEFPYLSVGAKYHHERYDGKGYPDGLKGDDIPEIARIVAVADAYDVMSSKRNYRDPMPQLRAREELVKGADSQFDPKFARIMIHMIDLDSEYTMKEKEEVKELAGKNELICGEHRSAFSEGIRITPNLTKIHLKFRSKRESDINFSMGSVILFDSMDGRIYTDERKIEDWNFYEYCEIRFDGYTMNSGSRNIQTETMHYDSKEYDEAVKNGTVIDYDLEAVKYGDHVQVRISSKYQTSEVIVALPDKSRYAYLALSGENCHLTDVNIRKSEESVDADYIPRIAEEVSYITGPEGNMPSIQCDGYRSASTIGVPIVDQMKISFHSKGLPTARMVWHCPFIEFFYSDDKRIDGPAFVEYGLVRLDGESWETGDVADTITVVNKTDEFKGWDAWKESHKNGLDCEINIKKEGELITTTLEDSGISVIARTMIHAEHKDIYVSLSGDQVVLTNINITT